MSYHRTRTGTRKRRSSFKATQRGRGSLTLGGTFVFYRTTKGGIRGAIKASNKQATRVGYVK